MTNLSAPLPPDNQEPHRGDTVSYLPFGDEAARQGQVCDTSAAGQVIVFDKGGFSYRPPDEVRVVARERAG